MSLVALAALVYVLVRATTSDTRPARGAAGHGDHTHPWIGIGVSCWILMFSFSLDLPVVPLGVFEAATVIALRGFDVRRPRRSPHALVLHVVNLLPFLAIGIGLLGAGVLRQRPPHGGA